MSDEKEQRVNTHLSTLKSYYICTFYSLYMDAIKKLEFDTYIENI